MWGFFVLKSIKLYKMNTWTVVLHFGRGHSTIYNELTLERAQELINIAVFFNRDCVNANIFQSTKS